MGILASIKLSRIFFYIVMAFNLLFSFNATAEMDLIQVTGVCSKKIESDRVRFIYNVEVNEKDRTKSSRKANKIYSELLRSLKTLKLKDFEESTDQYSVSPNYKWRKSEKIFTGYRTLISLSVVTSEKDRVGRLVEIGNKLGVQNINGPQSFVSNSMYKKVHLECLREASADAKMKAGILAAEMGVARGKVRWISESGTPSRPPMPGVRFARARMETMAADAGGAPDIKYAKKAIDIRLNVQFAIK